MKLSSCHTPPPTRRCATAAYSLVEMTMVVGILGIVLLAVMQVSLFTARGFAALGNYTDLDKASRNALDTMSRDIRQAKVLGFYTGNSLFFTNLNSASNSWFGYVYNQSTKTVYRYDRMENGSVRTAPLLTGCDQFTFRIWLRNPTNQFWFPYTADGQASLTKLVDVSWRCSRRVLNQYNTESVQTAKIVLRN